MTLRDPGGLSLERTRMAAPRQSSKEMISLFIYWVLSMPKAEWRKHRQMTSALFYRILRSNNQTVNIHNTKCDRCRDQHRNTSSMFDKFRVLGTGGEAMDWEDFIENTCV